MYRKFLQVNNNIIIASNLETVANIEKNDSRKEENKKILLLAWTRRSERNDEGALVVIARGLVGGA